MRNENLVISKSAIKIFLNAVIILVPLYYVKTQVFWLQDLNIGCGILVTIGTINIKNELKRKYAIVNKDAIKSNETSRSNNEEETIVKTGSEKELVKTIDTPTTNNLSAFDRFAIKFDFYTSKAFLIHKLSELSKLFKFIVIENIQTKTDNKSIQDMIDRTKTTEVDVPNTMIHEENYEDLITDEDIYGTSSKTEEVIDNTKKAKVKTLGTLKVKN